MKWNRGDIHDQTDLDEKFITETARIYNVPAHLIYALIEIESAANAFALRYESHYKYVYRVTAFAHASGLTGATEHQLQKFSWGLMQIMGGTARWLGFEKPLPLLLEPKIGVSWGTMYFGSLFKRYGNEADAVSAYNQGSPRRHLLSSDYKNQEYVDKVFEASVRYVT